MPVGAKAVGLCAATFRVSTGFSVSSFASFEDPDGNGWLLQEIHTRLPGREWKLT
jgi:hypothetical protein